MSVMTSPKSINKIRNTKPFVMNRRNCHVQVHFQQNDRSFSIEIYSITAINIRMHKASNKKAERNKNVLIRERRRLHERNEHF